MLDQRIVDVVGRMLDHGNVILNKLGSRCNDVFHDLNGIESLVILTPFQELHKSGGCIMGNKFPRNEIAQMEKRLGNIVPYHSVILYQKAGQQ